MDKLEKIAREYLRIDTLEERSSDSLDFHEVYCDNLLYAVIAAFELGRKEKISREDKEGMEVYLSRRTGRPTMKSRGSDGHDFFEVSVWGVKEYLEYAYSEGECGK